MFVKILLVSCLILSPGFFCPAPVRAEQPAPAATAEAQSGGDAIADERPLHFSFSKEKVKEFTDAYDKFQADPAKEDFARLEALYALARTATAPAADGQIWIDWFYETLARPTETTDEAWNKHFAKLNRWMETHPDSFVPLVVAAHAHISRGWQHRGSGYANTVKLEQWQNFHKELDLASDLLEKSRRMKGHDAAVYERLIVIGMATDADPETIEGYLAAAQKIDPRHYDVYLAFVTNLLPRWGGAPGDAGRFAERIWKQNPGGDGPEIYARIASTVQWYDASHLIEGEFDLQKVVQGAKIVKARYPNAYRLHNFAALVAWRAQDLDLARATQDTVRKHFDGDIWKSRQYEADFHLFCQVATQPPANQRIAWSLQGKIIKVAVSPSGKSVVAASYVPENEPPLKIRSLKTLKVTQELPGTAYRPIGLAIDPTGKRLAASFMPAQGTPPQAVLYNVGDWQNPLILENDRIKGIGVLCFSPDGKQLAAGHGIAGVGLWNTETGKLERFLEPKSGTPQRLVFSSDGTKLLIGLERGAEIWEVAAAKRQHLMPPERKGFSIQHAIAFDRAGSVIGYGIHEDDHQKITLFSWNPMSDKYTSLIPNMPGHDPVLSSQGTFVALPYRAKSSSPHSESVYLWSVRRQRRMAEFGGFCDANPAFKQLADSPACLVFSQDEKTLVAGCLDGSVRVWDISEHLADQD